MTVAKGPTGKDSSYYRLNVHVPQNSYVEDIHNVMVLGGGTFRRCLGHEDGPLMDGISALMKETPESSLAVLPPYKDTKRRQLSLNQEYVLTRH